MWVRALTAPGCLALQKEQLSARGRALRGMSEEEVFAEVASLFRGQEDLLSEFGQFLPEAKRSLVRSPTPHTPARTRSALPHFSRTPMLTGPFYVPSVHGKRAV